MEGEEGLCKYYAFLSKGKICTLLSDEPARDGTCQGVADGVGKVFSEIVGEKLPQVHHRGVIFAREPASALSWIVASDVSGVADRRVRPYAIVCIQSVQIESLP